MAQRWISPIRSKRLAAVARDGGAKGRFADVRADMVTETPSIHETNDVGEKRIEPRQRSFGIERYLFWFGPRHRRTRLDYQNRVRGSVGEIMSRGSAGEF